MARQRTRKDKGELTFAETRFVEEYLASGSAENAYVLAGLKAKSGREALSRASDMLSDRRIQDAIVSAKAQRLERLAFTEAEVLDELRALMFSRSKRLYREDGGLKSLNELDDDTARAVASVKVRRLAGRRGGDDDEDDGAEETVEVKLWDKNSALDKGMRYLGLYARDNAQQPATNVIRTSTR